MDIPTIGIGASAECDGQILVLEDMLGLNPKPAKFVREFAQLGTTIKSAVADYAAAVRARQFPADEHTYGMKAASQATDAAEATNINVTAHPSKTKSG